MKIQLTSLLLLGLLFTSVQARIKKVSKLMDSSYANNAENASCNQYESEITKIKSEIKSKEEQLSKIAQDINRLRESEVRTSAMFDIARKNSIKRSLGSDPIDQSDNSGQDVKKSRMQYACRQK